MNFAMATWRRLKEANLQVMFVNTTILDMELSKRTEYINSFGDGDVKVCISFHANAGQGDGFLQANGFELLHYPSPKSTAYAARLLEFLKPQLLRFEMRDRGLKPRMDLALFNRTKPTCLMIEAGFMNSHHDYEQLVNPQYQDAIGQAVTAFCLQL